MHDARLDAVAQERSVAMAAQGTFAPSGLRMLRDRLHAAIDELSLSYVGGENVARADDVAGLDRVIWNYEEDEGVFPMRERIGDCELELVGIGVAADLDGRLWGTQTFLKP